MTHNCESFIKTIDGIRNYRVPTIPAGVGADAAAVEAVGVSEARH